MVTQNYIKWGLIILTVIGLGVFLLNIVGKLFIQEITQEVFIKEESEKIFGVDIGKEAPHWELLDLEGNSFTLSNFLGEPLVLTFWASWNSISADQIKIFDEYLTQNKETVFKIVSINNQEDKSIVLNFIQRGGYKVPVLLDETGKVGELYKIKSLPVTYFLDKDGVIRDVYIGVLSERMLLEKAQQIIR